MGCGVAEVRAPEEGVVWLGQDEEQVVVVHSERAGVMMRGDALKWWCEGGMVRKMAKRTVSVKVKGVQLTSTYQPVWDGGNSGEIEEEKEVLAEHARWKGRGEILVIGGDFNAHVGGGERRDGCGRFGLRKSNRQGQDLLEWCEANGVVHANSFFQHKRRGTWNSNFNGRWYELDGFLMVNEQRRRYARKIHTVNEATISDHEPKRLVLDLKQKAWRTVYQRKKTPKINFLKLKDEEKGREYKRKVGENV